MEGAAKPEVRWSRQTTAEASQLPKNAVLDSPTANIEDAYDMAGVLGVGGQGSVFVSRNKQTGQKVAVKILIKPDGEEEKLEALRREVRVMWALQGCTESVDIIDCFEDDNKVYIVMEICSGGDLFNSVASYMTQNRRPYTERDAARLVASILRVIKACHDMGVIHKDVKLENFLLTEDGKLKCADFGLSEYFTEGLLKPTKHSPGGGTIKYLAPELAVLKLTREQRAALEYQPPSGYDQGVDLYAAGVTMYTLLSGAFPFNDAYEACTKELPKLPVSEQAMDLMQKLVAKDPTKRIKISEALQHPWVQELGTPEPLPNLVIERMRRYSKMDQLTQAARQVIANALPADEIEGLRTLLESIDTDRSGTISLEEMRAALHKKNAPVLESELQALMEAADIDGSGDVSYNELLSATITHRKLLEEDNLKRAFEAFDKDGNGSISHSELVEALRPTGVDCDKVASIIEQADHDQDGHIDWHEFVHLMLARRVSIDW